MGVQNIDFHKKMKLNLDKTEFLTLYYVNSSMLSYYDIMQRKSYVY